MKRITSLSIVVLFVLVSAACSGNNGPAVKTGPLTEPTPAPSKPAPVVATPISVALSELKVKFTPKPECDGGECYDVDFDVSFGGVAGNNYSKHFTFGSFDYKVGGAKNDPEIVRGRKLYAALSSTDPKKLSVTITNGEITKIVRVEEVQNKTLIPEAVLWDAKFLTNSDF